MAEMNLEDLIQDYLDDVHSLNNGVLVEWINTDYNN